MGTYPYFSFLVYSISLFFGRSVDRSWHYGHGAAALLVRSRRLGGPVPSDGRRQPASCPKTSMSKWSSLSAELLIYKLAPSVLDMLILSAGGGAAEVRVQEQHSSSRTRYNQAQHLASHRAMQLRGACTVSSWLSSCVARNISAL